MHLRLSRVMPPIVPIAPIALAAITLAVAACSAAPGPSGSGLNATLEDFTVDLSAPTTAAGQTRIGVTNAGATIHELEVFTLPDGVDPAKLTIKENVADTQSAGMTAIDEVEDVAPGTGTSLTVDLQPGRYLLICNLPTHYQLGMHTVLSVK